MFCGRGVALGTQDSSVLLLYRVKPDMQACTPDTSSKSVILRAAGAWEQKAHNTNARVGAAPAEEP